MFGIAAKLVKSPVPLTGNKATTLIKLLASSMTTCCNSLEPLLGITAA